MYLRHHPIFFHQDFCALLEWELSWGTSLVSLLSSQKVTQYFKLEVSFVLPSLVAPLSLQDDGIKGQTNILSDPPFFVDHGDAIYQGIGCHLG